MHRIQTPAFILCLLFASAFLLYACGSDDEDSGPKLDGIYKVDSHTLNEASCEAPGAAAAEPYDLLLVGLQTLSFGGAGGSFMQADDCPDLAECRTRKAETNSINLGGYIFDKGSNASGWTGSFSAISQGDPTSSCQGTFQQHSLTPLTGESGAAPRIRIEVRRWPVTLPPGPEDPNEIGPNCDDSAIAAEAQKNPCERLEVIEATFLE